MDCYRLSFPEEIEGDTEEPESRLSWLPAPLRKPLVTGSLIIHLLQPTQPPFTSNVSLALSVFISQAFYYCSYSILFIHPPLAFKCSWICCNYQLNTHECDMICNTTLVWRQISISHLLFELRPKAFEWALRSKYQTCQQKLLWNSSG